MPQERKALAYPWGSLDRLPRSMARNWGALQRQLEADSITGKLTTALARWFGEPVRAERQRLRPMPIEPDGPATRLRMRLAAGTGEVVVCLDTRLVARLVAFALKRDAELVDPLANVEPALLGAAAAIVAKIIDDADIALDVEFAFAPREILDPGRAQMDFTLHVGATAYPLVLGVTLQCLPLPAPPPPALEALGALELTLPLVVGVASVYRDELSRLAPGTALLTGSGLWVDAARVGRAALIAPCSDRGTELQLQLGGKIVLGEPAVTINHDGPAPTSEPGSTAATIADTLLEAPVVVRIEMGAVTLPAKAWAQLRPGDILETGEPLGSDVTLRVAGKAIAKGELLNVEGELGVRITQLLVGDST